MIERSRLEPEPVRTRSCFDDPKPALFRVRTWNALGGVPLDVTTSDHYEAEDLFLSQARHVASGLFTAAQLSQNGFILDRVERSKNNKV